MKLSKFGATLDKITNDPIFVAAGVALILWFFIGFGIYLREPLSYQGIRPVNPPAYSKQVPQSPFFRKPFGVSRQEIEYQHPYDIFVYEICGEYGLDPDLVRAIIWTESNYKADAVNYNGTCFGLMQISKKSHRDRMARLGVSDLTDPSSNILVGVDLLSYLFQERDDLNWVLAAYNAGYKVANYNYNHGIVGPYSKLVMSRYDFLKNGGEIDGVS